LQTSRKLAAAAILVIITLSSITALYLSRSGVAPSISLAPSTFVAEQGTAITFTVFGLESDGVATVYFGNGHEANTTSFVAYTYLTQGRYLVAAEEFVDGQPVSSTFNALQTIQITPQVSLSLAPLISIPVLTFDVTKNPNAPIFPVNSNAYLYGGFLELPTGMNVTITQYVWDFGNGATKSSAANSTSLKPTDNPVTATYSQPGLYPVTLTLVTENSTSMTTYTTSVEQTIAVSSSAQPYTVFLYAGNVPNPSVINVADAWAGGPTTLDPDWPNNYFLGYEVIFNAFSDLLTWNGSSTTNFIPMTATQIPSVSNGEISSDYTTYTFQIRSGMKFSNGDPLTAYDVWYSTIRGMLFVAYVPATNSASVGLAEYLVPGAGYFPIMANASDTADFNAIMNAVTYSNSSNTVTFKLFKPVLPQIVFDLVTAYNILDSKWLEHLGAGITFTPAGFYAIQTQVLAGSDNSEVQNDPVASGPYMIQSWTPGQSITLVPNPGYPGVPGIPAVHNTVVIQWVKDLETEYNLFRSGQADIATHFLSSGGARKYIPLIEQEVASGQAAVYQFPSLVSWFWDFTLAVNETAMNTDFGSQYHIPPGYFANLDVRKAFAYAFNYTEYFDNIQGNLKYGIDFGDDYAGAIVPGVQYHVPENQLQNVPNYNLTYAKQLLQQSGEYYVSINIPVICGGDPTSCTNDLQALKMWAAALNSIDTNIVMTPTILPVPTLQVYLSHPGSNPMPIWLDENTPLPYASSPVDTFYAQSGFEPVLNGWTPQYLNETSHPNEAAMYAEMNSLIQVADSTTNSTLAAQDYKQIEQLAINLYMYVYFGTVNQFWLVKPYMTGYHGQISYEENPLIGGGDMNLFYWWVKGCETPEACTGRNVGP
jgi:ABC-type transport system substrate-binding protein